MGKYTAELFDAVRKGDERAVASLLAKRASVASVDEHAFRSTPLHEAARHGWLSVMRVLIDNYADVNATNVGNETPLFYAAQEGRTGCVQLLLDMGADARIRSKPGYSAAYWAKTDTLRQTIAAAPGATGARGYVWSVQGHRGAPAEIKRVVVTITTLRTVLTTSAVSLLPNELLFIIFALLPAPDAETYEHEDYKWEVSDSRKCTVM